MTEIKLCPAKVLHALAGVANPPDTRPYLRGVWVENSPRGLILWATDGAAIAALRVGEMAEAESFNLLLPHVQIKGLPKNDKPVTLRASVLNATNKSYWGMPQLSSLALGAPRTFALSASVDF